MRFFEDILNIVFPNICCVCDRILTNNEEVICFHCRSELPKTNFTNVKENELVKRLYGKLKIDFGLSYLRFYKSGITQKLLHKFKYKNYPEIGKLIGHWVGYEMLKNKDIGNVDLIIPVPLHPKREMKRGYNQTLFFAQGISEVTKIPIQKKVLIRKFYNQSQTHKTKEQRWTSVQYAFMVKNRKVIEDKQILLVDDIVTTGATLEACGNQILQNGALRLGVATMALAK